MTLPWQGTTEEISSVDDSRYETPGGAQSKVNVSQEYLLHLLKLAVTGLSNGSEAAIARYSTPYDITYDWLKDRLDAADEREVSLNSRMLNFGVASFYGVLPHDTADATAILNAYFALLKTNGHKYAYFDKPGTYVVNGELTNARDLILIGNAQIKTSVSENYFIKISPFTQFNGRYNPTPNNPDTFKGFYNALLKGSAINVAVWGDSISTGGNDCINISYNSGGVGALPMAPNGLTEDDCYYYRLIDELTDSFMSSTFNFYNRSGGGANLSQWQQSVTFNGVTKAWIEHIKDTSPDLVIIGFGMNMTTFIEAKTYKYYLKSVIDYILENFTKIPSIALITTPRPCVSIEDMWGSYETQMATDMTAYQSRKYGSERGCYIIDVSHISNVLRSGTDFTKPILREFTNEEIQSSRSGNFGTNGSEYTFINENQYMNLNVGLKDFTLDFYVKFSGFPASSENLWIDFNSLDGVNNTLLIIPNTPTNKASINAYPDIADSEHFNTSAFYDDVVNWNNSVYKHIRIEKRDDVLNIYVNSTRVLRCRVNLNNIPGKINLKKSSGSMGTITIQSIRLFGAEYPQYTPTLTDFEMWGKHIFGEYSTKPTGGNGVNHPTPIGVSKVYHTAIKEFINDLRTYSSTRYINV